MHYIIQGIFVFIGIRKLTSFTEFNPTSVHVLKESCYTNIWSCEFSGSYVQFKGFVWPPFTAMVQVMLCSRVISMRK